MYKQHIHLNTYINTYIMHIHAAIYNHIYNIYIYIHPYIHIKSTREVYHDKLIGSGTHDTPFSFK